jgi:succinate dehydrogenase/fumarate reductase-like Fe-S protein
MLSRILNSEKAIEMNIAIMLTFVLIRQLSVESKELSEKLKELESKYEKNFKDIYEAIGYLLEKDHLDHSQKKRARIGFKKEKE